MTSAADTLRSLAPALAFLLAAVPLAALLDRLGFFSAAAETISAERSSLLSLWVFAAAVTVVLNLDTTVVLLTPLYFHIGRHRGVDPVPLAVMPLLLASLASSVLPVSNLTNLIAAERLTLTPTGFITHLAAPALGACTVGWWAFQRRNPIGLPAAEPTPTNWPVLVRGGTVVAGVLVGFTLGASFGIPAWVVAVAADIVLIAMTRSFPLRKIPVATAAIVAAVGIVVAAVVPADALSGLLDTSNTAVIAATAIVAAGAANMVNNLPALLIALNGTDHATWGLWAWLLGVNAGAALVPIGALANLLWLRIMRSNGTPVAVRRYLSITVPVIVPALLAATAILTLERVAGFT